MLTRTFISKAIVIKNVNSVMKNTKRLSSHGTWTYRLPPPAPPRRNVLLAQIIGGLSWYWVLYHIVTEPEHILGEFPYVDPSTYTDAELGIPPDDAGSLLKN